MIEPSDTSAAPSREESDLAVPLRSGGEQGKAAGNDNPAKDTPPPRDAAIPEPEVPALPQRLRLVRAIVERDGKEEEMNFITNNFEWAASSIADLYKHRWAIEAFFKQLKQTLQLCAFLGHSKKAIQWQVWTALLVYVLLRFLAHVSDWPHSFTRLFGLVRCSIWTLLDLLRTLRAYGTAGGDFRMLAAPGQAYLPGFA